jgi:hypothetical protein
MKGYNLKIYNAIEVIDKYFEGWVIMNAEKFGTETYKFTMRKGKKHHHIWKDLKSRCYPLSTATDIHPTETIVSVIKKVEKEFKLFPKILAIEQIDDWMVIISEWGKGKPLDKVADKMRAMRSYGRFLKRIENLGIYPRDGKWNNIVYNGKHDFAYLCDFGRFEIYVEGGLEIFREKAMNYKEELFRIAPGSKWKVAFYEGYNKKN